MASTLPSNAIVGQAINTEPDFAAREAFVFEFYKSGNKREAARLVGIHINTAAKWSREKWFAERMEQVRREFDKKMDRRLTGILDTVFTEIEDRLAHGETRAISTREGVVKVKVPLTGRDLTVMAGVMFDKRAALRKAPETEDNVGDGLERIADKLRQYQATGDARALRGEAAVVDVEATPVSPAAPAAQTQEDHSDLI